MRVPHPFSGLFTRRNCIFPTRRGAFVIFCLLALFGYGAVRTVHPFLATNAPLPGGFLVVEGWVSDEVLEWSLQEFQRNHYQGFFVTGGPIEKGTQFSEYKTHAEFSAACLRKMSSSPLEVQAIPSAPVGRDRTYTSALALRTWGREHGTVVDRLNVVSVGPHARRTRLLYEKAFGQAARIGILAAPENGYDPRDWWRSSAGFRAVIDESVAYLYARFCFWPPVDSSSQW